MTAARAAVDSAAGLAGVAAGLAAVATGFPAGAATVTAAGLGPTVVRCGLAAVVPRPVPTIETAIIASRRSPLARSAEQWIARYPIAPRRPTADGRTRRAPRAAARSACYAPRRS